MYSLRLALKSLWHDRWINLLSVITIATGLFILGVVVFSLYNVEKIASHMPERFTINVFLSNKATDRDIKGLIKYLKRSPIVKDYRYISKEDALKELRRSLKDAAYILEGIDENPLFPSVVVRIKSSEFDKNKVMELIDRIKGMSRVDDVIYAARLFESIEKLSRGFRLLGLGIILLFSLSVVFVSYSTVKILFYRRNEEIEIYKLLGATKGFIRSPFIIEGSVLGALGGCLASAAIFGFVFILKGYNNPVPFLAYLKLPMPFVAVLPVVGLALGAAGSTIALGRLKYQDA
ncbi:MAG TPA: ABC transporter permease [Nitrospirae bacterium]|nr:ABC transporter permease [Nitrospirota bacterium]